MATAPSSKLPPQLKGEIINLIEERLKELYVTRSDFRALQRVMKELAEAQKRTEQRMDALTQRMEELAEAQKRTEQRMDALTQALTQTQLELKQLVEEHKITKTFG